ncbi:helix-turn-helix transcriptional regulator [Streptomyces sp. GC420]|uniref:helix-turn-helix domain-containing protein n=1 Tax=Streptomyces sp. GC420 TaxID=2697568 RepID=UPI001414CD27|nr:helix-turn-helix transcriptional regulator [Streptomyces sp. GC420]NBM15344.1 hypothetical protein [Streptomyces sp. GC420]
MGCETSALATPAPLTELAQWLRSLRRRSGLSYRQMARQATTDPHSPVPHLRFHHADRGTRLPAWNVVQTYVRVCGGDEQYAARLWKKAEAATAPPGSAAARRHPALPPQYIREPIELLDAMREMRFTHGNKSLRALSEEAGVGVMPRSTLSAVLSGRRMPSKNLLMAFVEVCGGVRPGSARARLWEQAWERADAHRRGLPMPTAGRAGHDPQEAAADQPPASAPDPAREEAAVRWRDRAARLVRDLVLPRSPLAEGQSP